jgi:hypothetical protein
MMGISSIRITCFIVFYFPEEHSPSPPLMYFDGDKIEAL